MEDVILHREIRSVKAGQVERFKVEYTPGIVDDEPFHIPSNLWIKVKNKQLIALRAAYLAGPYILYVDCRPDEYDQNKKCFVTADQPVFEPQLLPGQSFYAELSCRTIKDTYNWTVDVISQILFNNAIAVEFEFTIGTSKQILQDASFAEKKVLNADQIGSFLPNNILTVNIQDTLDLWNLPVPDPTKPIHLVIVTHGLHSNVSADMLYLKETIDLVRNEDNIVVKGFFGNTGKTERGVKYLGSRVAEYLVDLVTKNETFNNGKVGKISFIGHSLGGLVQTFAIAYLHINFPWFFKKIQPINFITLALPLLGVANENPLYVKLALLVGIVGVTGQDLGLKYLENNSKPLLLLLPTGPTHQALRKFKRRTVYANAINDGVVPLRTSSLLYLDYKALSQIIHARSLGPQNDGYSIEGVLEGPKLGTYGFLPFLAILSYLLPQKQSQPENEHTEDEYKVLPRSSFIDAIGSLILPPLPSIKYITDPDSRDDIVIHDEMYDEANLPALPKEELGPILDPQVVDTPAGYSGRFRKRLLDTIDYEVEHLEEEIAKEYHKNMIWRKVVVMLKPDAHNNIIVRRRFANAYGWPVIDHVVKNHFCCVDSVDEETTEITESDSLDNEVDLSSIIARDLISKHNDEIELQQEQTDKALHEWVNDKSGDAESFFAVGPTGMLGDVSEMVGNFKDQVNKYGVTTAVSNYSQILKKQRAGNGEADLALTPPEPIIILSDLDLETKLGHEGKVMGGFI